MLFSIAIGWNTEEKIDAVLPELDRMLSGGLITLEKVRVMMYRAEPGSAGGRS